MRALPPPPDEKGWLSRNPPFLSFFIYESLKRALASVHCTSACSAGFTLTHGGQTHACVCVSDCERESVCLRERVCVSERARTV